MELRLSIERRHIVYLIASLIILTGINYSIAQTGPPNPGHPANQVGEGTIAGTLTISNGKVGIGVGSPSKDLEISGTLGFSGGTGPFCIFANECPDGWINKGSAGYIYNVASAPLHTIGACPYEQGGPYNTAWDWCHPQICCNE